MSRAKCRRQFAAATILFLVSFLSVACNPSTVPGQVGQDGAGDSPMVVERDVAVPMRDGTVLRADVYRPNDKDRFPVLVYRTPYGKHSAVESYETHSKAVSRGYAVVVQDVRGRYASEGSFDPYRHEGKDGYDTIEWTAKQSWSNGRVGTYGLSYPGAVQWLAAMESPPHLQAMAPAMTFSSPSNFFYMNGVFDLSWLPWIYLNVAPDARARLGMAGITTDAQAEMAWPDVADEYKSFLPLAELPFLHDEAPFYFEWLKHAPGDEWWDWAELRGRYDRVSAAVLNLSGWYDEAYGPEGAITNFNGLVESRQDAAAIRTHLIMGPWKHGVAATMSRQTGEIDFGPDATIDYDETLLRFFDFYLRDLDNGLGDEPPIRHFVMGANQWQEEVSWPSPAVVSEQLFFTAMDESGKGGLDAEAVANPKDSSSFDADPANPVTDPYDVFGPHDYQQLAERDDLLIFETPVLKSDWQVSGATNAILYLSCDCRDFDIWVKLLDVAPSGAAINLMSPGADVLRASFRDADKGRQLLEPGRVYELQLDGLLTSNMFKAGHRLRAQVSASFSPHLSRNLQTGESEVESSGSRVATITLHHDLNHPSRLVLPIKK